MPKKHRWIFTRVSFYYDGEGWFRNASTGTERRFKITNVGGVHGRPFSFHAKKYFGIEE